MGNPTLYWYPDESGSLEKLDFGQGVTDLQELPSADVDDAYSGDGAGYRSHHATTLRFRLILERFGTYGTSSLERKFVSLQAHLFKGGFVGFSRDHAKTWAAKASSYPSRGLSILYCGSGNGFSAWNSSADLAVGDEVVVESVHPDSLREVVVAASGGGTPRSQVQLDAPVVYTYAATTIVRWRDFYPVCWLPSDQVGRPIVTSDHRRNWTLDVTLEYLPAGVAALYEGSDSQYSPDLPGGGVIGPPPGGVVINPPLRDQTYTGGFGGSSLDQLLAGAQSGFKLGRG